jgi:hypothetical protein
MYSKLPTVMTHVRFITGCPTSSPSCSSSPLDARLVSILHSFGKYSLLFYALFLLALGFYAKGIFFRIVGEELTVVGIHVDRKQELLSVRRRVQLTYYGGFVTVVVMIPGFFWNNRIW